MEIYRYPIVPQDGTPEEVESIDYTNGIRVYLRGHKHPFKGLPSEGAVAGVNMVKKLILEGLSLKVLLLTPRKSFKAFERLAEKAIGPYVLKPELQMPLTRQLIIFLKNLGVSDETSHNIAHIFEYDTAYRARFQDLLGETTKEKISQDIRGEIKRLLQINRERDYIGVHEKFRRIANLASYLLLIPWFRNKVIYALWRTDFKEMQPDESDLYWISLRKDYGAGNKNKII